jgi:hypothetical protein
MTEQTAPVHVADPKPPYVIATERGLRLGIYTGSGPIEVELIPEAVDKLRQDLRRAQYLRQEYPDLFPAS